ncbi:MAG: DNA cytosine methyltransferase [Bacteroidia bacterium]|nr:DNA cytosine methyltransferase [Bacteroidia bacterium]
MKILNAYCGIGGNRKLWTPNEDEHEIIAVEYNEDIAAVYQDLYPNDIVIIGDAHEYLLRNYKEFDFIWASPPCPTHSRLVDSNQNMFYDRGDMQYPDMKLYQEIILLKSYAPKTTKWVIENVVPYYEYLIKPNVILHRHPLWCNFQLPFKEFEDLRVHMEIEGNTTVYGVSLEKYKIQNKRKRQILRNMVNPELGKYILDRAMEKEIPIQGGLF